MAIYDPKGTHWRLLHDKSSLQTAQNANREARVIRMRTADTTNPLPDSNPLIRCDIRPSVEHRKASPNASIILHGTHRETRTTSKLLEISLS